MRQPSFDRRVMDTHRRPAHEGGRDRAFSAGEGKQRFANLPNTVVTRPINQNLNSAIHPDATAVVWLSLELGREPYSPAGASPPEFEFSNTP